MTCTIEKLRALGPFRVGRHAATRAADAVAAAWADAVAAAEHDAVLTSAVDIWVRAFEEVER